ncbi:hypothetical protein [Calothrix sp. PCC 7507]|uniref:hypothetical protein n=1 Tax=Calothrix sp. PCC 7507 TaxID=99598 RepID=UPI00029EEA81|nr:hypothetical protein [Calothrix sp. PCC 7507]AFY36034.1 hypothetical protein Cal7507_5712 [Calothrix sp. PCC 7507]
MKRNYSNIYIDNQTLLGWFTKKTSGNEFGEYLPDEEAQLQEESIRIRASNDKEAQEKCEQESEPYNGIDTTA